MKYTVYASDYAKLDSNVHTGGGTDDTEALQAMLDLALEWGRLHVIMDGAALIRGLKVHSNTTIECMDKDCGFFLMEGSNCAVIENSNPSFYNIKTRNITLLGGTYNQNAVGQAHHIERTENDDRPEGCIRDRKYVMAMEFYGVENLTMKGVTIVNQRTFAFMAACWKHINIEDTWIDLPQKMYAQNQDGFHFWGPGQFLTMKNVGGTVGDDFMNIGPDENDQHSSIEDVYIDGVMLDGADQAIRMLSRGTGRLDRVTVRNVTGTYRGVGFFINSWFPDKTYGNFGSIKLENIDLHPLKETYEFCPPFLFQVGGNIELLSLKNIYHLNSDYKYYILRANIAFYNRDYQYPEDNKPCIKNLIIDGMHITCSNSDAADHDYVEIRSRVDNIILRDIDVIRDDSVKPAGSLIHTLPSAEIKNLIVDRVFANRLSTFIRAEEGKIGTVAINNALYRDIKDGFAIIGSDVCDNIIVQKNLTDIAKQP